MDLLPLPQPDPPSSQPPGSCMTHSQPLRFSQDKRIPPVQRAPPAPPHLCTPQDSVTSWQAWRVHLSFLLMDPGLGSAWEPGTGLEAELCASCWTRGAQGGGLGSGREWTHCETPRARGSRDRPAEPRYPAGTCYPGTAHCFFAQEPVEAGGNVSGTMQGRPQSCWGPPFSDPTGGNPYVPPSKPLLPWHSPLGFPWLSLLTPPRLSILTRQH